MAAAQYSPGGMATASDLSLGQALHVLLQAPASALARALSGAGSYALSQLDLSEALETDSCQPAERACAAPGYAGLLRAVQRACLSASSSAPSLDDPLLRPLLEEVAPRV
jgi:hypothetical protein